MLLAGGERTPPQLWVRDGAALARDHGDEPDTMPQSSRLGFIPRGEDGGRNRVIHTALLGPKCLFVSTELLILACNHKRV